MPHPQAAYIDRRDFLNVVVREKKRFEASLDDAVAQGLNAAVNILMSQVEHLVTSRQDLRDFTPDDGADFDLTPTRACRDAVAVLQQHCDMLKGSTDKHILEVFNQEVGIRLFGCAWLSRTALTPASPMRLADNTISSPQQHPPQAPQEADHLDLWRPAAHRRPQRLPRLCHVAAATARHGLLYEPQDGRR